MRPVEISAALGGVISRLIDGRDVERECKELTPTSGSWVGTM